MLSVTYKLFLLSVIMLNVVILIVVAPTEDKFDKIGTSPFLIRILARPNVAGGSSCPGELKS
jgi:hypothetical protein